MSIRTKLVEHINRNYRQPRCLVGRVIGERMVRQHQPENAWSVSLLNVQPADHVLEVGFGPGVAIQLLASQAREGKIIGVDYSRTMVRVARRRNIQAVKAGRVDLRYGEATALPCADTLFDKALSIHTLYFWTQPVQALLELQRVLKPGGTLALTFMPRECWPDGAQDHQNGQHSTIAGVYTGTEVVQLMREAGFTHAHVEAGPEQKPFREIAVLATKP